MILAALLVALTAAAVLFAVWPLFRRRRAEARRADYDIAVYRDQLREIERDVARGLLDSVAAQSARLEIERRLLAADAQGGAATDDGLPRAAAWRWTLVLALVVVPAAVLVYLDHGAPGLPQITFAERAAQTAAHEREVAGLVRQVEQRLAEHPDDLRGWVLLARAYVRMGRIEDALRAQAKATDLYDQEPDLSEEAADAEAAFGELLVETADGQVTPEARAAFVRALGFDERSPRARYFLALAKMQAGDPKSAVADWKALIAEYVADGKPVPDWLQGLKEQIEAIEAARGAPAKPAP
jgi:cytochrome c-type biogenesis protein CcmH